MKRNIALLLGLQAQGLFLAKSISPYYTSLIGISNVKAIGYYSKSINPIIVETKRELVEELHKIFDVYGGIDMYITSGSLLDFIINDFPECLKMFNLRSFHYQSVRQLSDKRKTYKLCDNLGIDYPRLIDAQTNKNKDGFSNFIAKWSKEDSAFIKRPFKTKQLIGKGSLLTFIDDNKVNIENGSLIIQELIDKNRFASVSYLGYYINGCCQGGVGVRQIRQYPAGITSALTTLQADKENVLKTISAKLIHHLSYTGFAEVEFLADNDFKEIYLIEVNPRLCGWSSALSKRFNNLGSFLTGKDKRLIEKQKDGESISFLWINPLRDLMALFNDFVKNKSGLYLLRGLKTLFIADVYDGIYKDEPMLLLKFYMQIRKK